MRLSLLRVRLRGRSVLGELLYAAAEQIGLSERSAEPAPVERGGDERVMTLQAVTLWRDRPALRVFAERCRVSPFELFAVGVDANVRAPDTSTRGTTLVEFASGQVVSIDIEHAGPRLWHAVPTGETGPRLVLR